MSTSVTRFPMTCRLSKLPRSLSQGRPPGWPCSGPRAWALIERQVLPCSSSYGLEPVSYPTHLSCGFLGMLTYHAAASVGLYAVQIAALFGFEVATVCSPRHFPLLRSLGARHVFDYRDPEIIPKIREALPNLRYVFDTIGNETSSAVSSQAIRPSGGSLCTVRPFRENTEDVTKRTKVSSVLVFTAFLRDQMLGPNHIPVRSSARHANGRDTWTDGIADVSGGS